MTSLHLDLDSFTQTFDSQTVNASRVTIHLPRLPRKFYRHGWQSWSLATWIDPSTPAIPISAAEFRLKDEDPVYSLDEKHTSAWISAIDLGDDDIVLLGGLGLGSRVRLDSNSMVGFYEAGEGDWFVARGKESEVFVQYVKELIALFGTRPHKKEPRVWCSWYSLYALIHERILHRTINLLGDLSYDVIQIDDGWQVSAGDWEANKKFPSGMADLAARIKDTARVAGLWLSPLIITPNSSVFRDHPDWLLKNDEGNPVFTGRNWSGKTYALDVTHPAVLDWLDATIHKARGWGYQYFKLDFLYAGAFPGKQHTLMPREDAYRNALRVMREAAGDSYLLACGAPIIPSLGLCDGMRIGPDVTPYWSNVPLSVWLNNPNHPGAQNAIRTCIHRQWLRPLVHLDSDAVYFRQTHLAPSQQLLLQDLARVCGFKVSSDLPQWLTPEQHEGLKNFLLEETTVERIGAFRYRVGERDANFVPAIPLPPLHRVPTWLATNLGILQMGIYEVLPAFWETRK
jgi:alpha-galactosidase